jgi:uncharacterized protein (TIGR02231 family)
MKRLFLISVSILIFCAQWFAQEINANSQITDVTVYRTLARETRSSSVTIPSGNSEIVISGVTTQLIDQSIQVSVKGNATLLSAVVRMNYFNQAVDLADNPKYQKLQDSIETLTLELRWIAEERGIHVGEIDLVSELLKSGSIQKDYKPADLDACADIYRKRMSELRKKLFDLQLREESILERQTKFQGQINEMGPKPKAPVKEIVLSFWSETESASQIKISYLTGGAGWIPMYDLNVENTSKPVAIVYKASVFQSTGMDWKNVNLTVATANPGLNNDRPILSPRYIDYVTYTMQPQMLSSGNLTSNSMYIAERQDDANFVDPFNYQVNVTESDIHVEYDIDIKQNIPSDGKQHICKLQDYSVPATYRYHAVPKLEAAAFLLARITHYGQYNLLAGQANVFFGDTYVGQVTLNPQVTGDTLLVSLGRDEKIVVKRNRIKEKTGKKILSGVQKETYAYEITVRNNKGAPIEIEILDQIPLTRRKEIIVKFEEKSGAEYDETSGRILWNIKIDANKSKVLDLEYTVEYLEGQTVGEQ